MAKLGHYETTVQDSSGNAINSVSVELRKQGATVNADQSGTSPLTVTVNDPGLIDSTDSCQIWRTETTAVSAGGGESSFSVDSTTETTVVLSGFTGTLTLLDEDRISPTTNLLSLFNDIRGDESLSNPLTTSSLGFASGWSSRQIFDIHLSGGTPTAVTTRLKVDRAVVRQDFPIIPVTDFGATGDGSTDDTTAIQAAIDFAKANSLSTVFFPSGTYNATQIVWKTGVSLIGSGINPSSDGLGTTLKQISGTDTDFIVSDTGLASTGFQHWVVIKDMRLSGNTADTTGSGIKFNSRTGEGLKFEHLFIRDFPESGIELTNGTTPLYCEDLHFFSNGKFGIDITRTASDINQMVSLNLISGDDNTTALINIKTSGGVGNGETYIINGVKAEKATSGKQNNAIILDNMNGSPVFVSGVGGVNTSGENANSLIRIQNATCRLTWVACDHDGNYTSIVDDAQGGETFTGGDETSGAIVFTVRALHLRHKTATTNVLTVSDSDEANTRFQVRADGLHEWSDGAGANDTNLFRSAANTLKTDDAFIVAGVLTASAGSIVSGSPLNFGAATELTIATGAITVTQSNHKLQPQSGASDDLDTINGGTEGDILLLYTSDSGDTITLTESGNIIIGDNGVASNTLPIKTATGNGLREAVSARLYFNGTNWINETLSAS